MNNALSVIRFDDARRFGRLAAAAWLTLALGCGAGQPAASDPSASNPNLPRASVRHPERKTLLRIVELPGSAEPYESTPLYAKVSGYVKSVAVDIGDVVQGPRPPEPGAVLCELDVPELVEALAEKQAIVERTQSEILQADAGVVVARAQWKLAEARVSESRSQVRREEALLTRWESELTRMSALAESGATTRKVADETRSEFEAAQARREEALARIQTAEAEQAHAASQLEKAEADAQAVRAQVAVAEAEKRRQAALLDYAVIRAPYDGVIVERNVHTGRLVAAGSDSQPLLTLMRTDPIRIRVEAPETEAVHIRSGASVEVRAPALTQPAIAAQVTRTSWSLKNASRSMTCEIDIPNADGFWRPGQYVQVKLRVAELPSALSLPKSAVLTREKQTYCLVVDENDVVTSREITLGLLAGTDFEVRDGLTEQDRVITVNPSAFREGQHVTPTPAQP